MWSEQQIGAGPSFIHNYTHTYFLAFLLATESPRQKCASELFSSIYKKQRTNPCWGHWSTCIDSLTGTKNHICWSVVWCDIEKKNALRKLEIVLNPTLTQIRRGWAPYFLPLSFSPPPMGIRKFLFSLLLSTMERGAPPSLVLPPSVKG